MNEKTIQSGCNTKRYIIQVSTQTNTNVLSCNILIRNQVTHNAKLLYNVCPHIKGMVQQSNQSHSEISKLLHDK